MHHQKANVQDVLFPSNNVVCPLWGLALNLLIDYSFIAESFLHQYRQCAQVGTHKEENLKFDQV